MTYYLVKYSGHFGFIKPWTAVRDSETFSQQFLTPSIVAGIERKLFPSLLEAPYGIYKIQRHRLTYQGISMQQEQIQPRGWNSKQLKNKGKKMERPKAVLKRGVLVQPTLYLAFANEADAQVAKTQHICLCRNEDILFPDEEIIKIEKADFDDEHSEVFAGVELLFEDNEEAWLFGYNRFNNNAPMYGHIKVVGNQPIQNELL